MKIQDRIELANEVPDMENLTEEKHAGLSELHAVQERRLAILAAIRFEEALEHKDLQAFEEEKNTLEARRDAMKQVKDHNRDDIDKIEDRLMELDGNIDITEDFLIVIERAGDNFIDSIPEDPV